MKMTSARGKLGAIVRRTTARTPRGNTEAIPLLLLLIFTDVVVHSSDNFSNHASNRCANST